jgi:rhodanese-related sulfurtransferase
MHLRTWIYPFILSLVFSMAVQVTAGDIPHPDIARISAQEAHDMVQSGKDVVFLDFRTPASWQKSNVKIANAIRIERGIPLNQQLAGLEPEQILIAYCT